MNTISILDYGMGNIGSLSNMIRRVGGQAEIIDTPDRLSKAEKLILPGVGHFGNAMKLLQEKDLIDSLNERVLKAKVPILCICLGAQLITERSEECEVEGLGWIQGRTIRFDLQKLGNLRIPHMGWNDVRIVQSTPLFVNLNENPRFYFVHSFHLAIDNPNECLCTTEYGYEFVSGVQKENIFATQFHPEKSHSFGLKLLENFLNL